MVCEGVNRCNQMYHDRIIENAVMERPYSREEVVYDLRHYGTSPKLLVSESKIPKGIDEVISPYDDTVYPVLRLKRYRCPLDNVLTSRIDWTDIEPGVYVEDRFLIKITVKGDTPITADETNRPLHELSEIRGDRLEFDTFGTVNAEWKVNEEGQIYPARFSSYEVSPKGMGAVKGVKAVETKKYDNNGNLIEHTLTDEEGKPIEEVLKVEVDEGMIERIMRKLMKEGWKPKDI